MVIDTNWNSSYCINSFRYFWGALDYISWGYSMLASILVLVIGIFIISQGNASIPEKSPTGYVADEQETSSAPVDPKLLEMGENGYYHVMSSDDFNPTGAKIHARNLIPYGTEQNKEITVLFAENGAEFKTVDEAKTGIIKKFTADAIRVCNVHGAQYALIYINNPDVNTEKGTVSSAYYIQLFLKNA